MFDIGRTCNASQSSVVALATSCLEYEQGDSYASFKFPGDHTARVTPVPIPNTEVKPRRADDTARATVWERRSPPGLNYKGRSGQIRSAFFVCVPVLLSPSDQEGAVEKVLLTSAIPGTKVKFLPSG